MMKFVEVTVHTFPFNLIIDFYRFIRRVPVRSIYIDYIDSPLYERLK